MSPPVVAAATCAADAELAASELRATLGDCQVVFVFYAVRYRDGALVAALQRAFPGACVMGCTTHGEIGPQGLTEDGVSALGIRRGARCAARVLDPQHAFHQGAAVIEAMAQELGTTRAQLDPRRHLLLLLADGLSCAEERTVASLGFAAPNIRLVGGSAGDHFELKRTDVCLNGQVHPSSHLVALLELEIPFQVLHVHHFQPTDRRVVVTRADPARRRVIELDGWPALQVMAEIYQRSPAALVADPEILTREPVQLAYTVGGDIFVRSVLGVDGNDLLMAGAVDEGSVLRVVRGEALLECTREGVRRSLAALPGAASGILLFNCRARQLEAEMAGISAEIYQAMAQAPAAGFNTNGEQLDGLHVNHTLTGVVFGE